VPDLLIASDAEWVHRDIRSVLSGPGTTIRSVYSGAAVLPEVLEHLPDLAILDLQIGNMGAMAISLELHLEEGVDRLDHVPVLILLDRRADVFLARRSDAEGWLMKPIDPIRLRRATRAIVDGGTYFDTSYLPDPVSVPVRSSTVEGSGK
jgi:DNA-binding NarL/FixJ family response regulator